MLTQYSVFGVCPGEPENKACDGEAHSLPGVPAIAVRDNVGTANQPPLTALATLQNTDRQGANAVGRRPQEGGSGMETDSHEGL